MLLNIARAEPSKLVYFPTGYPFMLPGEDTLFTKGAYVPANKEYSCLEFTTNGTEQCFLSEEVIVHSVKIT